MDFLDALIARRRRRVAELREQLRVEEIGLAALEEAAKLRPSTSASQMSPAEKRNPYAKDEWRKQFSEPTKTVRFNVLILRALYERFPNGATTPQLMEFIKNTWNRTVTPNSFSVRLNQLAGKGEIYQENRLWYLVKKDEESQ